MDAYLSQLLDINYFNPSKGSSEIYRIPHRDIVEGVAPLRLSTSKIIEQFRLIIHPLVKHNLLLLSNAEFIVSIHSVSTAPSNI